MKILILNGHDNYGNGGAASIHGSEQVLNRSFSNILANGLRGTGHNVTVWNPSINDKSMYTYLKSSNFDFTPYDLVFELHFNAKTVKDVNGDGRFTGTGFYYPASQTDIAIAQKVCNYAATEGFKSWAISPRSDLLVCNRVSAQKVPFFLWEIAFIDDGDDMAFFKINQGLMANWIVKAVGVANSYKSWVGHVINCENDTLNVRSAANPKSARIAGWPELGQGNQVEVIGEEFAPDGRMWYHILIAGKHYGYINAAYLYPDAGAWTGKIVVTGSLNVRRTPEVSTTNIYTPYSKLGNGNMIDVLGAAGDWYRIRIANEHIAYVHSDYVKRA